MRITTRLTERFGIDHPVVLAPMDKVSGGRLAGAVSAAGGLGLIGGGYGEGGWLESAFAAAGNQPVGVGFITWSLAQRPELLDVALAHGPRAVMVSFGDAEPFVAKAKAAGVPTLWQVQRLAQARQALAAGADVIVAQGQEAGGHGMDRGLFTLVPAIRDLARDDAIVVAAGGIADGRGLAAALALGADGVLVGTRFWASAEADGPDTFKEAIATSGGDDTIRTKAFDVARRTDWPWHYTGRVMRNPFADANHEVAMANRAITPDAHAEFDRSAEDDPSVRPVIAGEAADLIRDVRPAADIVSDMVEEAGRRLEGATGLIRHDD